MGRFPAPIEGPGWYDTRAFYPERAERLSNAFTNLNLRDMETGYKVFRREVIQKIGPEIQESRFGIEPELTARLARIAGVRVFEVPISYSGRSFEEGKKITWRDGVSALRCIVKYGLGG